MIQFEEGKYFSYEMVGEFRSSERWIHPTRVISNYELIIVNEGTVYLEENGSQYVLGAGDMLLLEPNMTHGGYRESDTKTAFYWFHFQTDYPLPFKTASCADFYDIRHYVKKLLNATSTGCTKATADTVGFLIFDELSKTKKQGSVYVQNIMEYVRINSRRDISVLQIAEEFGYNPDYLGRLFKKHTKMGLKEYISGMRLAYAKEILLTTSLSIREIAEKMGYKNENLFIKFFGYHEKITPTEFRSRYAHTHMNNR